MFVPPTQLCKQCRCTVDLVRLEATLQLSIIYKSCLIYWVGGRDSSLQKLVEGQDTRRHHVLKRMLENNLYADDGQENCSNNEVHDTDDHFRTILNPSSGRKRSPGKLSENNKHVHRHRSLAWRRSRVPSPQKPSEVKDNGTKV